ncbi:hypothetical protein [Streptomyces sp. NPDC058751]|uniref:hypothetical protein n=1 Tax=Streptomyces sp. NPDC058751 TaxID=3346623 RepID=UPI003687055B
MLDDLGEGVRRVQQSYEQVPVAVGADPGVRYRRDHPPCGTGVLPPHGASRRP